MYIQRVAKTARLIGVTGSPAKRGKIADALGKKFSKMIEDTFERKEKAGQEPVITLDEIKSFFKELVPNVKLKIFKTRKISTHGTGFADSTSTEIVEHYLKIPFTDGKNFIKKSDYENLSTLDHEKSHFLQAITEPKYIVHDTKGRLSEKSDKIQWDFYDTFLYKNELEKLNLFTQNALKEDPSLRVGAIKKKIDKFFKQNSFSTREKIDILQNWRHYLKTEVKAYKEDTCSNIKHKYVINDLSEKIKRNEELILDEYDQNDKKILSYNSNLHDGADKKIKALQEFTDRAKDMKYQEIVETRYFFPQKLKIVEEMLAQGLQKARAKHKIKLDKNNLNLKQN